MLYRSFLARQALLSESIRYGFQMASSIENKYTTTRNQFRATAYLTHQYRHLLKVSSAEGTPGFEDSRKKSQDSMDSHNASFSDLPSGLVCPAFEAGIKKFLHRHGNHTNNWWVVVRLSKHRKCLTASRLMDGIIISWPK